MVIKIINRMLLKFMGSQSSHLYTTLNQVIKLLVKITHVSVLQCATICKTQFQVLNCCISIQISYKTTSGIHCLVCLYEHQLPVIPSPPHFYHGN